MPTKKSLPPVNLAHSFKLLGFAPVKNLIICPPLPPEEQHKSNEFVFFISASLEAVLGIIPKSRTAVHM